LRRAGEKIGGDLKYHSRATTCNSGHKHASRIESEYCQQLHLLEKAKQIISYKSQVAFNLEVNGKLICKHIVDFLVMTKKGEEVHEVKGFATRDWKLKRKLFEAIYPQIKYYVITNRR
jgi:hypothetical protein